MTPEVTGLANPPVLGAELAMSLLLQGVGKGVFLRDYSNGGYCRHLQERMRGGGLGLAAGKVLAAYLKDQALISHPQMIPGEKLGEEDWVQELVASDKVKPLHALFHLSQIETSDSGIVDVADPEAVVVLDLSPPDSLTVQRKARDIVDALWAVLSNSSFAVFVDRYFNPSRGGERRTLQEIFRRIVDESPKLSRIAIVASPDAVGPRFSGGPKSREYQKALRQQQEQLRQIANQCRLPSTVQLEISWSEKEMHDRHLFTQHTCLLLGAGFAEERGEKEMTIALCNDRYQELSNRYWPQEI